MVKQLHEHLNTVILWIFIRIERRNGTPLRKGTNKDHFRCLIICQALGSLDEGLMNSIFVKTSNS